MKMDPLHFPRTRLLHHWERVLVSAALANKPLVKGTKMYGAKDW